MNKLLKLIRSPKIAINVLPVLTRNQLKNYAPKEVFWLLDRILRAFVKCISTKTIEFVPRALSALLVSYALESKLFGQAKLLTKRAQSYGKSQRLAFSYEIEIAKTESLKSRDEKLQYAISHKGIEEGRFSAALLWAYWNLSLIEYATFIKGVLISLEDRKSDSQLSGPRLLPEFTTNMGHLGYLVSYLGYYKNQDPTREIVLWPDQAPNTFFMKLVLEQSPIRIVTQFGKPDSTNLNPSLTDRLLFSRESSGSWRYEHDSAVCSGQRFPELTGTENFKLTFPVEKESECLAQLEKIGFDPEKWFVLLHIRESVQGNSGSTQARDSEISKFSDFCNLISDLGGQVVRMGSRSFPKLSQNFRAIDYAHSTVSNEVIDCWLWSNCKWWTGNANGASIAAHSFGAPRVVVDMWFWNNFGPSTDLFLPKIIFNGNRPLTMTETVNHSLSRTMNPSLFKASNLKFEDNTSEEIVSANLDMYQMLSLSETSSASVLDQVDYKLSRLLRNPDPFHTMRISPSFRGKFHEIS